MNNKYGGFRSFLSYLALCITLANADIALANMDFDLEDIDFSSIDSVYLAIFLVFLIYQVRPSDLSMNLRAPYERSTFLCSAAALQYV